MAAPPTVASPAATSEADLGPRARAARFAVSPAVLGVVALTAAGAVIRVLVAHQSVFADELSTYWISASHGLGGVVSLLYSTGRIHYAEISPPLSFVASWLSTQLGTTPELMRLPALLAGTATIPLVFLLGLRSVGRRAALLATALTALSPFMIYYSAEARAYGLLMFLVLGATLSMLLALDTGRRRWWVLYALCAAAAFYTHYTSLFVLAVQLAWLLWAEPRARRPALLASAGAALLAVPWIPGLIQDLHSPTVKILSALSPLNAHAVRVDIEHWAIGYPYAQSRTLPSVATGLRELPGVPALVLLAISTVTALVGVAIRTLPRRSLRLRPPARVVLVFALMLAAPVGELTVSAFGDHIIGVRDLAVSWPFLVLSAGAIVAAAGPRLGAAAAVLAVGAFGVSAAKMLESRFARPNYQAAADYVATAGHAGDVVVDATGGVSPGPLTGFDVVFRRPLTVVRAQAPAERDHPFNLFDRVTLMQPAFDQAVRLARGGRVFLVAAQVPPLTLPDSYRLSLVRRYPGLEQTVVAVYSKARAPTS
jgi:uncharacterized membrane protein